MSTRNETLDEVLAVLDELASAYDSDGADYYLAAVGYARTRIAAMKRAEEPMSTEQAVRVVALVSVADMATQRDTARAQVRELCDHINNIEEQMIETHHPQPKRFYIALESAQRTVARIRKGE